jgi:hypothetical protein
MCFISCAAECSENIYFIQSSDKVLSEFYIIIFLNKLKIVENTPKKSKNPPKSLWLRLLALQRFMSPFLDLWAPDRCTD